MSHRNKKIKLPCFSSWLAKNLFYVDIHLTQNLHNFSGKLNMSSDLIYCSYIIYVGMYTESSSKICNTNGVLSVDTFVGLMQKAVEAAIMSKNKHMPKCQQSSEEYFAWQIGTYTGRAEFKRKCFQKVY